MTDASPTREEIVILAKHAGLDLAPAYMDELVDAYRHLRVMVARLPQARPRGDEPAHVFDPLAFLPGEV